MAAFPVRVVSTIFLAILHTHAGSLSTGTRQEHLQPCNFADTPGQLECWAMARLHAVLALVRALVHMGCSCVSVCASAHMCVGQSMTMLRSEQGCSNSDR